GVGVACVRGGGRGGDAVVGVGGACVVLLVVVAVVVAPQLMEVHGEAPVVRALRAASDQAAAPIVAYNVQSASLRFYLRRPVLLRETPEQLRRLQAEHPVIFVLTSPRHVTQLAEAGTFVPWYVGPRRVLYASVPPPDPVGPH